MTRRSKDGGSRGRTQERRRKGEPRRETASERAARQLAIAQGLRGEVERAFETVMRERASRPPLTYEEIPQEIIQKLRNAWNAWIAQPPGEMWTLDEYTTSFGEEFVVGFEINSQFFNDHSDEILGFVLPRIVAETIGDCSPERLDTIPFSALPCINVVLDFFSEENEHTRRQELAVLQRGLEEVLGNFLASSELGEDVDNELMLRNRVLSNEIRRTFLATYAGSGIGRSSSEIQSACSAAAHRAMGRFLRSPQALERDRYPRIIAVITLIKEPERTEWTEKLSGMAISTQRLFGRKNPPGEA